MTGQRDLCHRRVCSRLGTERYVALWNLVEDKGCRHGFVIQPMTAPVSSLWSYSVFFSFFLPSFASFYLSPFPFFPPFFSFIYCPAVADEGRHRQVWSPFLQQPFLRSLWLKELIDNTCGILACSALLSTRLSNVTIVSFLVPSSNCLQHFRNFFATYFITNSIFWLQSY